MSKKFSAVILSAGYSGRMGVPKWSLKFDGKSNFAEKIAHEFELAGAEKVALVLNSKSFEEIKKAGLKFPQNLKFVLNDNPDLGRFYSLKKGVEACNQGYPLCFTNIDNPFVTYDQIIKLFDNIDDADYISPSFNGKGGHPCLLSSYLVMAIKNQPVKDVNLKDYLRQFKRKKVEVKDNKILLNINSPEIYKKNFNYKIL